jgi:transcriptional regulator with GAF, ATPase, and Fis domain
METPAPPSPYLLVRDPVAGQQVQPLDPSFRVTLGRSPSNRIVVHDELASRFHAEIFFAVDGWMVRDLESRNGTQLGGAPLRGERLLEPGAVIAIGNTEIIFCAGERPTAPTQSAVDEESADTARMPTDLEAWHASITHRRAHSRLLDEIRDAAAATPRDGRIAADLCRLAFALGGAADVPTAARLALEAAVEGTAATRGMVLLPPGFGGDSSAPGGAAGLERVAVLPADWRSETVPAGLLAAVLGGDEALLATPSGEQTGKAATISAPVRSRGRPVGILHLESLERDGATTPEDLEFVIAVCDALGLALDNLSTREVLTTRLATAADENERLRRQLGENCRLVGSSAALGDILEQVARVAATRATVLVRGESGSGKELVARLIHDSSDRRGGPFVCLNCAALSETLLESELFGHEKGAFTGATERKIGKFEAAHGGTLLLDEIGEMSPEIQAKFLRVLEGHAYERVGGSGRVQVDVRVVAATNRNLEDAVRAGGFRRDLYFRLKVVEIVVPPLRQRPDDVQAIALHFLERFAAETGRRIRGFTPGALEAMRSHSWPGNVRELRNCVERAVVLAQGAWIDVQDMALGQLGSPGDTGRATGPTGPFVPATIAEVERRHVLATLDAVGGNKTKAAAILGIERSTLDRKLAKWARD